MYIQALYGRCKNNGSCSLEIEPGPGGVKKLTNADPVAITAIMLPDNILSDDVNEHFGAPRVTTYTLTR